MNMVVIINMQSNTHPWVMPVIALVLDLLDQICIDLISFAGGRYLAIKML